jgi:hypothetical protein
MAEREEEKEPFVEGETHSREQLDWRGAIFGQLVRVTAMPNAIPEQTDPKNWARQFEWSVSAFLVLVAPFKDDAYNADIKRLDAWFAREKAVASRDPDYDLTMSLVQCSRDKLEAAVLLLDRRGLLVKKGTTETLLAEDEVKGEARG